MRQIELSKIVFYSLLILTLVLAVYFAGMYSGRYQTMPFQFASNLRNQIQSVVALSNSHPENFLQSAIHEGNGVTINKLKNNDDYILLSSFFDQNNGVRLIKRDGEIITHWPLLFHDIFNEQELTSKSPSTNWNVDTHGTLILPDGSIVFNFEGHGLIKLNKCGDIIWKIVHPTHHSVEIAENGGFWVLGQINLPADSTSPYPPFQTPININTILKVSSEGKILNEISIPELFYKNNLSSLLTATGGGFRARSRTSSVGQNLWGLEIVHANKIAELSSELASDFPLFKAGDLLISMRGRNLLMVIDPEKLIIKWWKIGPWIRQHDPEFKKGGKISVFNNNMYVTVFMPGGDQISVDIPRISNIIEIDPVTNEHEIVYGGNKDQAMLSVIRGKHENLNNGGMLITEFESGRVFETDKEGEIVWQYINRYNKDEVAEITEARLYSKSYFTVEDWSCASK